MCGTSVASVTPRSCAVVMLTANRHTTVTKCACWRNSASLRYRLIGRYVSSRSWSENVTYQTPQQAFTQPQLPAAAAMHAAATHAPHPPHAPGARDVLLAGVAHDLKNPLTIISTSVQMLRSGHL